MRHPFLWPLFLFRQSKTLSLPVIRDAIGHKDVVQPFHLVVGHAFAELRQEAHC